VSRPDALSSSSAHDSCPITDGSVFAATNVEHASAEAAIGCEHRECRLRLSQSVRRARSADLALRRSVPLAALSAVRAL
jgi:hypothetical protein